VKIAILDDYQNVATSPGRLGSLATEVVVFTRPFATPMSVRSLAGFDVLVAMRERTASRRRLERLPELRSCQHRPGNAPSLAAAHRLGITVCGTRYSRTPHRAHLGVDLARREICRRAESMRTGAGRYRSRRAGTARPRHPGSGRVGSGVARVGQAFGMQTIA